MTIDASADSERGLPAQLITFSLTRIVLNSGFRMVYPFLPAIARGLGVDLQTMALAVTARSSLGALSPFLGSAADARGRRWAMVAGVLLTAIAFAVVPLRPTYAVVVGALLLAMIGKLIFDPALQAYIGDRIDYARRGMAIAVTEIGWSGAGLIGLPLVGWLMDERGWLAPFPWLAGLSLAGAVVLWRWIPADRPHSGAGLRSRFGMIVRHPAARAGLIVSVLCTTANETVNIMYGAWMESAFGLQLAALGAATAVIGLAELTGEGAVALLADRFGKRRLVGITLGMNAAAALSLYVLGQSLTGALVGLFLFYVTFEVAIVGLIPLMTEVLPPARATMMASNVAGLSLGRAVGAAIGPGLFTIGFAGNVIFAAAINLVAAAILLVFVKVAADQDEPEG